TALELVDEFVVFWEENRSVLRVLHLATDEGDRRFQRIRVHLLNDITRALAAVTEASKAEAKVPDEIEAMANAGVLVAMLAQVGAHLHGFESWDIHTADLRTAMARQIAWSVTGTKP
ncbi:MAG: TetR family transcriptional regulator, partial [Acidimicrobiales bacterium]